MLWLGVIFIAVIASPAASAVFLCHRNQTLQANPLPQELALPLDYEATIRYTNFETNQTFLLAESNFSDVFVLQRTDRTSGLTTFVVREGGVLEYNATSCANSSNIPSPYALPLVVVNNVTGSNQSFSDILKGVLNAQKNFNVQALFDTPIVGGIDALAWYGCLFNATGDNSTGVQVEVYYATAKSLLPYAKEINNPLPLTVRFSVFKENTTTNVSVVSAVHSLDVSLLDKTHESDKLSAASVPRGLYCDGLVSAPLPVSVPDRFFAVIDFAKPDSQQINTIKVLYDSVLHITSFALDLSANKDIPLVAHVPPRQNGTSAITIYRDFNYGIQYVLSKDGRLCKSIEPLDTSYGDVDVVNGTTVLKSPSDLLFNLTDARAFVSLGQRVIEGVTVDSFVAREPTDEGNGYIVVEVNVVNSSWTVEQVKGAQLHSVVHYHKDVNGTLQSTTYMHFDVFVNFTATGPTWVGSNIFPCISDTIDETFFFVNLQNASLRSIRELGSENVEAGLAEALSAAGNVSVLRLSYFLLKQAGSVTVASFLVSEKSNVTQTKTAYLLPELTVAQFRDRLNATLANGTLVAHFISESQKPAAISIDHFGIIPDHDDPPPAPKFVGFSRGSLFIVAVFAFIFGAGGALGLYIVLSKRRSVSSMAYQVFE